MSVSNEIKFFHGIELLREHIYPKQYTTKVDDPKKLSYEQTGPDQPNDPQINDIIGLNSGTMDEILDSLLTP